MTLLINADVPWFDRNATVPSSRPAEQTSRRAQGRSMACPGLDPGMAAGHRRRRRAASCVLGMSSSLGVKVPCAT
jgi:hypothetical protein